MSGTRRCKVEKRVNFSVLKMVVLRERGSSVDENLPTPLIVRATLTPCDPRRDPKLDANPVVEVGARVIALH